MRAVARELGVRYVLEGSVRKSGNRVRITGQLIQADSGSHIWAERYDGDLTDIFELQDKVTIDVVSAITPKLEQAEIERSRRKPTESLDAYDLYWRSLASFYLRTREGLAEARRLASRAMELDPGFALAHAMAAWIDGFGLGITGSMPGRDEIAETDRLARRAVDLDRDDPVVLGMAAWAMAHLVHNLDTATGYVARALALNPNLVLARMVGGWLTVWQGEPERAIEHFVAAKRLSPLDPNMVTIMNGAAHACYMSRRYDEGLSYVRSSIQIRATLPALRIGAASAAFAGRLEEAGRLLEQFLKLQPGLRVSTLEEVLGPYRRREDVAHYKDGLRLAGLPE